MIDGLINGMMLILLHPLHNILYKGICCLCHKSCIKCCNVINNTECLCNKFNAESDIKDIRLQLSPITVNLTGINIKDIKSNEQAPIDILLTQSLSNIYRNAAASQPSFGPNIDIHPIPTID
mgnify:CR=1 FL=1